MTRENDNDIDVVAQIGAVQREVRDGERDGEATRTVVASRNFDTTVDDLWDAITSAERLARWFLPVSGDLRLGGRYQLEGNAGGEITACDPPRLLAVTWEFSGEISWLVVRLSDSGDCAHLELEHEARPGPHWDQFGPGAAGIGWDLGLLGLALHVDSGAGMDPAAAAEWQASDQAKELMRLSGDGWRSADIAAGTPPDVAESAARATIEAYTGEG